MSGTKSAKQYYIDALNFSEWVNKNIGDIKQENIRTLVTKDDETTIEKGNKSVEYNIGNGSLDYNAGNNSIFDVSSQDPEEPASTFNQHRIAVIKSSIETNLMVAINSYNSNSSSSAFALPELTAEEWDKVVNNVCVISFLQGLPMGGKYFNGYVVIPNDKNNEFVDIDSIYLLTSDGQYHLANCSDLVENIDRLQDEILVANKGSGYINTSFERQTLDDGYYYRHVTNATSGTTYTACYHCIVNASGKYDLDDIINCTSNKLNGYDITNLRSRYMTVLAREKYNLYKTNMDL